MSGVCATARLARYLQIEISIQERLKWKIDFENPARWSTAIVAYLRRAPHAGDTAEGIARWWLGATPDEFSQVADALDSLERLQVVQHWIATDGREHFCIGPALLADLKSP